MEKKYPSLLTKQKEPKTFIDKPKPFEIPTITLHDLHKRQKPQIRGHKVCIFGFSDATFIYEELKKFGEYRVVDQGKNWIRVSFINESESLKAMMLDRTVINGEMIGVYKCNEETKNATSGGVFMNWIRSFSRR